MNFKAVEWCALSFFVIEGILSVCRQDPYPNLCGYNGSYYNATEDVEVFCDCQKVIFCSVINFTQECGPVVQLEFHENETSSTEVQCEALPLETEASVPILKVLNVTGGIFSVSLCDESLFGMYTVFCTSLEALYPINDTASTEWEITGVSPVEMLVDSEVQACATGSESVQTLQLTLNNEGNKDINSTPVWCFITSPDNTTEVLSTGPVLKDQITCGGFTPGVPGVFTVSLGSGFPPDTFEKSVSVKCVGKQPAAQQAEYDFDLGRIFIYFDGNIEVHSKCKNTFSKTSREHFGKGFECTSAGNILRVEMGVKFKIINNITIKSENEICQEGSVNEGVCLSAIPATLSVSKPKISGPGLSFYKTNACGDNKTQNYLGMKVINNSNRGDILLENETIRAESAGKTHRKNLMMWRSMRQVQSKLPSRLILQVNKTDIPSLLENFSELDNVLAVGDNYLGSGASVSVDVHSSPSGSRLSAEAQVTFCNDSIRLFRYKWVLNGKELSEEGRLLILSRLPPGKYLIKCLVLGFDSPEILGLGWATAEVVENAEEVLIVPGELAMGTGDDIFLQAVTKYGSSVVWSCRTVRGGACVTNDGKLLGSVDNFTSLSVSLPAGSVPVGEYVWTAESLGASNSAKVLIRPGEVTVDVKMTSVFVNPSDGVVLNGIVRGAKGKCRIGWTSVRQKGFGYLDLRSVGARESTLEETQPEMELPLTIPPSSESLKALQSDSLYLFKLGAFCPQTGSSSYVKVPIRTSSPPTAYPVTVKPTSGEAMTTRFEVSGSDADLRDHPLTFEWSYVDPCDLEIPLGRGLSWNFTTYLPPGDVKIMRRACDEKEMCSTSVSSAVAVTQPPEPNRQNFEKSCNEIEYLMGSGDDSEAFGLAVTMLRSLALTAEFKIRKKVLSAVEAAVSTRIKTLSERLASDSSAVKLSLEFCERAEMVEKYFRRGSAILKRLKKFRNSLKN